MKQKLTQNELFSVADKLYKHVSPKSTMCTPNGVYISTEKWYKEYQKQNTTLKFFEWCIKNKQKK